MQKINILGKNLNELEEFCIMNNYPKFHGQQLFKWFYNKSIIDINAMTDIPKSFKEFINSFCIISSLKIENILHSKIDNTMKFLLKTSDNNLIECVSMINNKRHTVCVSSQIGCSVDCSFCATGKMGIIRNLITGEIIEQIIIIKNKRIHPITNIVFMGMGEPFLNYNNVINSCIIFHNKNGFNIGTKKITISTSGILPKIKQYIQEKHKFKLAISLNASNNKVRDQLIPINKKWPLEKILESLKKYNLSKYRAIMFEYVLLENINDSEENAKELVLLLKNFKCKLNIIPYNQINSIYKRSNKIEKFVNILNNSNTSFKTFIRISKGQDINAACGQLATNK